MIFDKIFNKSKDSTLSPTETIDYYSEGVSQFNAGNYTQAMEFFQAVIDSQPTKEAAYLKLAETYNNLGKEELAKKTLFALLAINPTHKDALSRIQFLLSPNADNTTSPPSRPNNSFTFAANQSPQPIVFKATNTISDPIINVIPSSLNGTPYWMVEQRSGNRFYLEISNGYGKIEPPNKKNVYWPGDSWKGFRAPSGTVSIPEWITIEGKQIKITEIGKRAFEGTKISSILLPASIQYIRVSAFAYSNLTEIEFPNGITEIVDAVCKSCISLQKVILPDSVISIGYSSFEGVKNLRSLKVPSTVNEICTNSFKGCNIDEMIMHGDPPIINDNSFGINPPNKFMIPKNRIQLYQNARYWQTMNLIPY